MKGREFGACPADFQNPSAAPPRPQRFRYPTHCQIRTAVVGARCAESETVRRFHPGWIEQIRQFGPEAIAAPVSVLKRLSESARYKGRSTFPTLTRAIVAFTG